MKCPRCGEKLSPVKAKYGLIYVCEKCGLMVVEFVRWDVKRRGSEP